MQTQKKDLYSLFFQSSVQLDFIVIYLGVENIVLFSKTVYLNLRKVWIFFQKLKRQVHEGLTQLEVINKHYRKLARENKTDTSNYLKSVVSFKKLFLNLIKKIFWKYLLVHICFRKFIDQTKNEDAQKAWSELLSARKDFSIIKSNLTLKSKL